MMKTSLYFKRSNLSWNIIKSHFMKLSTCEVSVHKSSKDNEIYNSELNFGNKFNTTYNMSQHQSTNIGYLCNETGLLSTPYLEYAVHACGIMLKKDMASLFIDRANELKNGDDLTALCFNHRTNNNMSAWDPKIAHERELLAVIFIENAKKICETLKSNGFWADFIDPYSGAPFYGSHTNDTLFETDPRMRHFGYSIRDLGCCKVLSHPQWFEHVFAGLIFTNAPPDHKIIDSVKNL